MKITIGGVSYRLPVYDTRIQSELFAWALSRIPDPLADVIQHVKGIDVEVAKLIVESALAEKQRKNSLTIDSPEIQAVLMTPEGLRKHGVVLFKRYQPALSDDQCAELQEQMAQEYGEEFMLQCEPETAYEAKTLDKMKKRYLELKAAQEATDVEN